VEVVVQVVSGDPLGAVLALHQAGRTDEAIAACRTVLRARPGDARAHQVLGALLIARGRPADALSHLETVLRLKPDMTAVRQQVAILLHQLGRRPEAVRAYRRVLAQAPDTIDAHGNLGVLENAAARLARAVALRPDDPRMLGNFGAVAGSARTLRRAVALAPEDSALHLNVGNERRNANDLAAAEAGYRRAHAAGRRADALANLALAAHDGGRILDAVRLSRRCLADAPASPFALSNASMLWKRIGRIGAAVQAARRALAAADTPEAWNNLGDALQSLGEIEAAASAYRRSGARGGGAAWGSNLLFCLCYDPKTDARTLYRTAADWAGRFAPKRVAKPPRRPPVARPRIGVLSSDFRDHPVGRNVLGLFEHRQRVEMHAYAEVWRGDALTAAFEAASDGWVPTVGMSDEAVAERMRGDGIDLLLVLAGHTARNRPLVAAWGAAPVQASFHDLTTSGLRTMDWWITDGVLHPESSRERFTEKLWRLPCFYLHRPPADAPGVGPLPCERRGHVTFVSCNNPAKVTPAVVRLWAEVLKAVPGSRLLLKYKDWFVDPDVRARFTALFAKHRVDADRLDIRGGDLRQSDQLALLNEADIALDPFPFNGSTTTFEALWMGVPAVTLAGERFVGRVGASVLTALGRPELIARDGQSYVETAVALAGDRRRLASLRQGLRPALAASPLCDARGYARAFEDALLGMLG
jgi:predicted O-linked N-acetylglucosamine transferase (SPINDLY family)